MPPLARRLTREIQIQGRVWRPPRRRSCVLSDLTSFVTSEVCSKAEPDVSVSLSFRVTRRDDTRTVGYHGDFSSNVPLRKQIGFTLRRECIHPDVRRTRSTARRIGWMQAFHART